jgi:hypothetical protein
MNCYVDGLADCGIEACPLYQYQPYREKKPVENTDPKKHAATELSTHGNACGKRLAAKDKTKEACHGR